MLLTTTNAIDGKKVLENRGVVATQVIFGANALKDMAAALLDATGGRITSYEKVFDDARNTAIRNLTDDAKSKGADAIIGLRIDYHSLGAHGTTLMVAAYGTAVLLTKTDEEKRKDIEHAQRNEARYYIDFEGTEMGPFSADQLKEMIDAQRISIDSETRDGNTGETLELSNVLRPF